MAIILLKYLDTKEITYGMLEAMLNQSLSYVDSKKELKKEGSISIYIAGYTNESNGIRQGTQFLGYISDKMYINEDIQDKIEGLEYYNDYLDDILNILNNQLDSDKHITQVLTQLSNKYRNKLSFSLSFEYNENIHLNLNCYTS